MLWLIPLAFFVIVALVWIEVYCPGLPRALLIGAVLWWLYTTIAYP